MKTAEEFYKEDKKWLFTDQKNNEFKNVIIGLMQDYADYLKLNLPVVVKSLPCEKCQDLETIIKNGLNEKDLDNDCT